MKNFFICFYSFAVISIFGFGHIRIPGFPFNFGQISYILLLVSCFIIDRKALGDKYLGMYAAFIFFYFLSSVFTGFDQIFFTILKRQIFIVIPLYWGTKILISRFNTIKPLLIPLIIIGILDTFVTIGQVYGVQYFDVLLRFLGVYEIEQVEYMERRDLTMGLSMNGIYSSPVHNGHNLIVFFCMSLALIRKKVSVIRLLPALIIFIGVFYCQQRSAFLIAVVSFLIFFFILLKKKILKKSHLLLISILILLVIFSNVKMLSDIFAESRFSDIKLADRSSLFLDALMFVFDNPLIGGYHKFIKIYGMPPHNTIISAFMAGGLIGGLILIYMMFSQMLFAYKKSKQYKSILFNVFIITFMALIADSMFHNTGYVQYDEATFIIWALILMFNNFERNENNICK